MDEYLKKECDEFVNDIILKENYLIEMEIEELNFIIPEFVKICNFYFERYGFGTKVIKPSIAYKFEKRLDEYKKRKEVLINKLNSGNKKN